MRIKASVSSSTFKELFRLFIPVKVIRRWFKLLGPAKRRPPKVTGEELIMGLVFHVLAGAGTLAEHVGKLTGKTITDGALSQRRSALPWMIFEMILDSALTPKAQPKQHPDAFYQGLRLCGLDGSRFSVANTPQIKASLTKAKTRRHKAAFAKVGVAVLVELGLHNPIGAAVGPKDESEMVLARQLLDRLPEKSLLISDRYYGVPALLIEFREIHPEGQREFLVRAKGNLKRCVLECYADGSALVEIRSAEKTMQVREITGRVRRGSGSWSEVRLWTSLLDWKKYPAGELLALYARRWEQESFYRELKVDLRSSPLVQSHTPLTAAQEIAALIIAYAVLVEERIKAAKVGDVAVLRISFLKTLEAIRGLWHFLEVTHDLLDARGLRLAVRRTMRQIAEMALPKRRQRSCPRALRQPVSSWPRLLKNSSINATPDYNLIPVRP
ncbi:MAG TPA: IS4 family transposase [Candidatus Saccharimonadales bacterium]|nr:IS4 family transposase [Candidatus Saccharimonadales bacterium]